MITAKEALTLTQKSWKETVTKTLDPQIKDAAAQGKRRLELGRQLTHGEEYVLKESEYDFEWNGKITTIWW